jgi:methylisocitrate lyase
MHAFEDAGAAGLNIQDRVGSSRPGRPGSRSVVGRETAVRRIRAAVAARTDPGFVVAGCTDAAAADGLDEAVERGQAYVDAGADLIFPEAMTCAADVERLRAAVDVRLAMRAADDGLAEIAAQGTQQRLLGRMRQGRDVDDLLSSGTCTSFNAEFDKFTL